MKLQKIRAGFATNSSSSHAIVFAKENIGKFKDVLKNNIPTDQYYGESEFQLYSREAKLNYLLTIYLNSFQFYLHKTFENNTDSGFYRDRAIPLYTEPTVSLHDFVEFQLSKPTIYLMHLKELFDYYIEATHPIIKKYKKAKNANEAITFEFLKSLISTETVNIIDVYYEIEKEVPNFGDIDHESMQN